MKAIKSKRATIVGIFIFLALAILVIAVFTLGGQKKTFVKVITVKAIFDDVSGLQNGNNVWLSGVKIGTIKKMTFTSDALVEVDMNIDERIARLIHKDAKAKVSSNGLMGNKIVVIFGGTRSFPVVRDKDFLLPEKPVSTEDMLATLQANNKNLLAITSNFSDISKKIAEGQGTIGQLLHNDTIARDLRRTLLALQSTVLSFKATAAQSQEVMKNLSNFTAQLNKEGTLINDLVTDTIMFNNLRGTITQLREVSYTASEITNNIKNASEQLNNRNNAAGALLNDDELAVRLKSTIINLEAASKNLNEDLLALQHNFFLRGYFKNKSKSQKTENQ
jgi:phospholipid/cholesterol/gamma-HCH transport system substrate-binding protein